MKELLERFRSNWLNLENKDEISLFQKHADKGKSFAIYYSSNY